MNQPLNVLHVEDSLADSELIRELLTKDGLPCEIKRVDTRTELFDELQKSFYDIILADYKLPNFSGIQALEIAHALKPQIPFIFVSGTIGEDTAIESLRNGATDYILKDRLSRLAPAVRRALAESEEQSLHRHLQTRLREAGRLEAVGTLSTGLAHDFNNILTIILGHASLLAVESNRPQRIVEISRTITEAARRASDVVEKLVAFASKSEGNVEPLALNDSIIEVLDLFREKIPSTIELAFDPDDALPMVMANNRQLERILRNLIANSVEAMPSGGCITLSTKSVPGRELPNLLPELAEGTYIRLNLTDTGSGMDAATRDHVFEPFYTTKDRAGSGLGLPVVYGLMRAQNGCVNIESEPGRGTTVSLFFPVRRLIPARSSTLVVDPDASLSGSETILLVEDEGDVCSYLETVLQNHGYRVFSAHDADEALALFQKQGPQIQLVFADIGLPKVDGITLCSQLKALNPNLLVILSSGYPCREFKERMAELGNDSFLSKPFQTHDLLQCIKKVLNGSMVINLS